LKNDFRFEQKTAGLKFSGVFSTKLNPAERGNKKLTDNFCGPYSQDYYDQEAQKKTTNVETKSEGKDAHNAIY
jgi:hypothetical protein